jgi:hypothetical protein
MGGIRIGNALPRKRKFQATCLRSLRFLWFQKTTQAPRAQGLRRPSPCPSSPQGTQRAQRFRGFTRGRGGGGESFLKITERQGFAHPHAQAFRWNFGFRVYSTLILASGPARFLSVPAFSWCSPDTPGVSGSHRAGAVAGSRPGKPRDRQPAASTKAVEPSRHQRSPSWDPERLPHW